MGKAFLCKSNGGGGGLAFRVIGGTSAPASPKPNDIWVNTSEKITSYIFSATEPEGYAQGMAWITIGTSSTIEFNALKKNGIQVYPISVKQYVNGAWVDKTAKSYQSGKWVDWWNGALYENGNEYTEQTGGFGVAVASTSCATAKKESTYIALASIASSNYSQRFSTCYTKKSVDLTRYKTLKIIADASRVTSGDSGILKPCITKTSSQLSSPSETNYNATLGTNAEKLGSNMEYTYDVSSASGAYYIGAYSRNLKVSIRKIFLV